MAGNIGRLDVPAGVVEVDGFSPLEVEQQLTEFYRELDERMLRGIDEYGVVTIIAPLDGGAPMIWEMYQRSIVLKNPAYQDKVQFVSAGKDESRAYVLDNEVLRYIPNLGQIIILDEIADTLKACYDVCCALYTHMYGMPPDEEESSMIDVQLAVNAELWAVYRKDFTPIDAYVGNIPLSVGNAWIYSVLMDSGLHDEITTILERMSRSMLAGNNGFPLDLAVYQQYLAATSLVRVSNGRGAFEVIRDHELFKLLEALAYAPNLESKFEIMYGFEQKMRVALEG